MIYIATFFSHYGAMKFAKKISLQHIPVKMMPVPRRISSSCGTCVQFEADEDALIFADEDMDGIYKFCNNAYTLIDKN